MKRAAGWLLLGALLALTLTPPRPSAGAAAPASDAARLADAEQQLRAQREQQAQLEREVKELIAQGNSVAALIDKFQRDINTVQAKLAQTTVQLDRLTADKNIAERKLTDETRKLSERQQVLGKRVREIYKRGGAAAYWQVLFTAKDFGDLIRRFRFLKLVMAQDAELIRELRTERIRLDEEKRKLVAQVTEIAAVKAQQDKEKNSLAAAKIKLEIARREITRNTELRNAQIKIIKENASRLQTLIAIIKEKMNQLPPDGPPRPPRVSPVPGGTYPWPLRGVGRAQVIRPFGSYSHPEYHVMVSNNGIDIAAPQGSPVLAIAAGTVVSISDERGYGKTLVISHGNNLLSLYAYLATTAVGNNTRVTAGQTIGTVGARPEDGKAALHLETHGDVPQDPLRWLVNR